MDYATIVSHAIAIAIGIAGSYFGLFRGKIEAVKNLIVTLNDALADGTVSADEVTAIIKAAKAVIG